MSSVDSPVRAADLVTLRLCGLCTGAPVRQGVDHFDALEKAGIEFVQRKHDKNAGFMAERVHHRDGAPAVLVATVGPGVVNGINVLFNETQDRVPLIVLPGRVDAYEAQTYQRKVFDHQAVLREITQATIRERHCTVTIPMTQVVMRSLARPVAG